MNNKMGSRQLAVAELSNKTETHAVRSKADNFQSEHDKFLKEFDKPTQIYRFMRAKFLSNPGFLYRNLSYMKNRVSRPSHKSRKSFKIDEMLKIQEKLIEEHKVKLILAKNVSNFMNIIVLGFCDGQTWSTNTEAKVEFQVIRIFGSRRKENKLSLNKSFSYSCRLPIKSQTESSSSVYKDFSFPIAKVKYPVVPIPREAFVLVNGNIVQSIRLAIRVSIPADTTTITANNNKQDLSNENMDLERSSKSGSGASAGNGRVSFPNPVVSLRKTNVASDSSFNNNDDGKEPKSKRQRSLPTKDRENLVYNDKTKSKGESVFVGVLTIYDVDTNINILEEENSDIEMLLKRQETKRTVTEKRTRRESSWEVSLQADHSRVQEFLYRNDNTISAKIALAFRTSMDKMPQCVTMIEPIKPYLPVIRESRDEKNQEAEIVRVVYYFVGAGGNNPRLATACEDEFRCPWCSINCLVLYSLLKHLEVCHPRFKFKFSRIANGARVDVSINESYDGSYTGSAYDLVAQPPGQAFGRYVPPGKRTQLFCMLAFKPKRMKKEEESLEDFLEDKENKNNDQNRSYMIGHNRLYHHTTTCLPIHAREIDVDSEGEPDPEWLKVKTCMMIDEFTDVNEGEKEIMKMWNHHIMHENYVGDCQIWLACRKFVDKYGQRVIEKNLYRNFVLHLTNLYDFGLLPAPGFHATVKALHSQMKENNSASHLRQSWGPSNRTSSVSTPSSLSIFPGGVLPMEIDVQSSTGRNGKSISSVLNGNKNL